MKDFFPKSEARLRTTRNIPLTAFLITCEVHLFGGSSVTAWTSNFIKHTLSLSLSLSFSLSQTHTPTHAHTSTHFLSIPHSLKSITFLSRLLPLTTLYTLSFSFPRTFSITHKRFFFLFCFISPSVPIQIRICILVARLVKLRYLFSRFGAMKMSKWKRPTIK